MLQPKAFLTIGETKQERVEYVGRSKQPGNYLPPISHLGR